MTLPPDLQEKVDAVQEGLRAQEIAASHDELRLYTDAARIALAALVERLEAQQEALTMIADYGHELDDYVLPPLRARKIARRALHPEEQER